MPSGRFICSKSDRLQVIATTRNSVLLIFPGALGDFVCFLPALFALRERHAGHLRIVAQRALSELVSLADSSAVSIDRREVADLFASAAPLHPDTRRLFGGFATVHSWTGFNVPGFAERLSEATGGNIVVYRFRGMRQGEHATEYYARCVGLVPRPSPELRVAIDGHWLRTFREELALRTRKFLVIHPGSGSPSKNWRGYDQLIARWRSRHSDTIIVLYGPADTVPLLSREAGVLPLTGLSLPQVAALVQDSRLYLGNDSGVSHLAGAVGARGVVLFGPSDPAIWAPRGKGLRIVHAPDTCAGCGTNVFCAHRLPVERVIDELEVCADGKEGNFPHDQGCAPNL